MDRPRWRTTTGGGRRRGRVFETLGTLSRYFRGQVADGSGTHRRSWTLPNATGLGVRFSRPSVRLQFLADVFPEDAPVFDRDGPLDLDAGAELVAAPVPDVVGAVRTARPRLVCVDLLGALKIYGADADFARKSSVSRGSFPSEAAAVYPSATGPVSNSPSETSAGGSRASPSPSAFRVPSNRHHYRLVLLPASAPAVAGLPAQRRRTDRPDEVTPPPYPS